MRTDDIIEQAVDILRNGDFFDGDYGVLIAYDELYYPRPISSPVFVFRTGAEEKRYAVDSEGCDYYKNEGEIDMICYAPLDIPTIDVYRCAKTILEHFMQQFGRIMSGYKIGQVYIDEASREFKSECKIYLLEKDYITLPPMPPDGT